MTEAVKIPERSQIPVEETWNLADLYPSDQAWEQDLEATRVLAQKLPGLRRPAGGERPHPV